MNKGRTELIEFSMNFVLYYSKKIFDDDVNRKM